MSFTTLQPCTCFSTSLLALPLTNIRVCLIMLPINNESLWSEWMCYSIEVHFELHVLLSPVIFHFQNNSGYWHFENYVRCCSFGVGRDGMGWDGRLVPIKLYPPGSSLLHSSLSHTICPITLSQALHPPKIYTLPYVHLEVCQGTASECRSSVICWAWQNLQKNIFNFQL